MKTRPSENENFNILLVFFNVLRYNAFFEALFAGAGVSSDDFANRWPWVKRGSVFTAWRWKIRRLVNLLRRKGAFGLLSFLYGKLKEKSDGITDGLLRPWKENSSREEFLALWKNTQNPAPAFRVRLLVTTFFDVEGNVFLQGGAERYTYELNRIIIGLGGRLEVFQCGTKNWHRVAFGVPVYGINTNGFNPANLNRRFHNWVPRGELTIYYQMILSAPLCHSPSVCVSHGVDWDSPWLQSNPGRYARMIKSVLSSVRNVTRLVSVDTNTINWLRSTDAALAKKCAYIPNFVDTAQFHAAAAPHPPFVVLYPRRLSEARGFWLAAGILPKLLGKYPDLQIHFCGKAEPVEQAEVDHLGKAYPGRVQWFDRPPDQMPLVYQNSDLVIIPTLYAEGTSLACLEALASGCPVVATNVGGLPDLILDGYNGILIEPEAEALYNAVCRLVDNPELRAQFAERGYETAKAFDLSIWRERWKETILKTKK